MWESRKEKVFNWIGKHQPDWIATIKDMENRKKTGRKYHFFCIKTNRDKASVCWFKTFLSRVGLITGSPINTPRLFEIMARIDGQIDFLSHSRYFRKMMFECI